MKVLAIICAILSVTFCSATYAGSVKVAVASNFMQPMKELVRQFEQNSPYEVVVAFGSSGKLYAQIMHGAPFDIFLSADQAKPDALTLKQMVIEGSQFTYAIGRLVLWTLDAEIHIAGGEVLRKPTHYKIALANPKIAPYGKASVEVLTALGLVKETQNRWVLAENITQSYQFVYSQNAQLGFVALSQFHNTSADSQGEKWLVPDNLHQPIRQDAVRLKRSSQNEAALAFYQYLQSQQASMTITRFGYEHNTDDSIAGES